MIEVTVNYRSKAISDAAESILSSVLDALQIEAWGQAAVESPVDTGNLKSSFEIRKPNEFSRSIFTRVPYAEAVHDGTRTRVIRPVNKKALYWKGAKHPVKFVRYPGTKANPYFDRALEAAERRIDEFAQSAIDEHLESTTGGN